MTPEQTNQYRRDVIAMLEKQVKDMEFARTVLSTNPRKRLTQYIVRNNGLFMSYDVSPEGFVSNPETNGMPMEATVFELNAARRIAANTFDGSNKPAEAVTLFTALNDQIEHVCELVRSIRKTIVQGI